MSNTLKDKFNPVKQFALLRRKWDRVDAVKGGTEAMRDAGQLYLPKLPAETLSNYSHRLACGVLKPIYQRTLKKGVGKALAKGIMVETTPQFTRLIDNADGAGTNLETFARNVLEDAIHYGITYLLVDHPITTANATLADERASGAFPYFVNIKPTQVLDIKTAYIGNRVEVVYFRFEETIVSFDYQTGTNEVTQIKEFVRLMDDDQVVIVYNIYRKKDNGDVYLYDTNSLPTMTFIPLVPVYGNKTHHYMGEPTLMELAEQSISHWGAYANYRNLADFTSIPLLQAKGVNQTEDEDGNIQQFVVSPNSVYTFPENGGLEYVEISGTGLTQLLTGIKDLEVSMFASGLELIIQTDDSVKETATGRLIDAAEANSILKGITHDLEWSLYYAFVTAGVMIGEDVRSTKIEIDASFTVLTNGMFNELIQLFKEGIITATQLMEELKARGYFASEGINSQTEFTQPEAVIATE